MTLDGVLQMFNESLRLTGGVKVVSPPDGTFFSKNLTPDAQTGIGDWTFAVLARSITAGIGRDVRRLSVMPSHYYVDIGNDDPNALIGCLRSRAPVRKPIPANVVMEASAKLAAGIRLVVPFIDWPNQDWYFGDFRADAAESATTRPPPRPSPQSSDPLIVEPTRSSPEIDQGTRFVTLAACTFCHTPVGLRGQRQSLALAGGIKVVDPVCGTVLSKNRTPDDEIARAIRHGVAKDGRVLCPTIMPWQAYTQFTDDE